MQKKTSKISNGSLHPTQPLTAEERHRMIAEAAYFRALNRGFHGGSAEDDWFAAEQEINKVLMEARPRTHKRSARAAPKRTVVMAEQTRH